jgi:hypothetical protein
MSWVMSGKSTMTVAWRGCEKGIESWKFKRYNSESRGWQRVQDNRTRRREYKILKALAVT